MIRVQLSVDSAVIDAARSTATYIEFNANHACCVTVYFARGEYVSKSVVRQALGKGIWLV